jgi:hypothetical protein
MTTTTMIPYTNTLFLKKEAEPEYAAITDFVQRLEDCEPTYEFLIPEERCLYLDVDLKIGDNQIMHEKALELERAAVEYAQKAIEAYSEMHSLNISGELVYALATSHGKTYDKATNTYENKYSVRLWFPEIKGHFEALLDFVNLTNNYVKGTRFCGKVCSKDIITSGHIYETFGDEIDYEKGFFDVNPYDNRRKMRCLNTSKPKEARPMILKHGAIIDTVILNTSRAKWTFPTPQKQSVKIGSSSSVVSTGVNVEKYRAYMSLIPSSKFNDYNDWFKISCASRNIGISFEVFDEFMKACSSYKNADDQVQYKENNKAQYETPNDNKRGSLGWGHIYKLAFDANPVAKREVDKKFSVNEKSYEFMKEQFEANHLKIINKAFFIKETESDCFVMKKAQICDAYEHLQCEVTTTNKKGEQVVSTEPFLKKWLKDPKQRIKTDIDIVPHDQECPENVYNLWKPFDAEFLALKSYDSASVEVFRNHIKVLCNHDMSVVSYFEKWIGQMLKFPSTKTTCPVLISKEGAGKGTLIKLLTAMIGNSRVFESTSPERDVWGSFNVQMKDSFLVVLNELSKKQTEQAEGKLKGYITDKTIDINIKGVDVIKINSYHRFMITTNSEDPIKTGDDDRRKFIVRSSDELIGNKQYFVMINKLLTDDNVVRSCYNYFVGLDGLDAFHTLDLPKTAYHADLKNANKSPIELWIHDFISKMPLGVQEVDSAAMFTSFNDWKDKARFAFDCNAIKFALKLKNLNIKGLEKHEDHHRRRWVFNIDELRNTFNMGPLISIDDDETDSDETV